MDHAVFERILVKMDSEYGYPFEFKQPNQIYFLHLNYKREQINNNSENDMSLEYAISILGRCEPIFNTPQRTLSLI
jgi:hypothetical protein